MKYRALVAGMVTATMMVSAASAQQIVNMAASDPSRNASQPDSVKLSFQPGSYTAQVVGKSGGGLYDGWSVATPAPNNWDNRYTITAGADKIEVNPYGGQRFATATDALDAFSGLVSAFTLEIASDVTFSIPDYLWRDNTGGVSIKVSPAGNPTPVPEPMTMGLFALGGAALMARSRRRRSIRAH